MLKEIILNNWGVIENNYASTTPKTNEILFNWKARNFLLLSKSILLTPYWFYPPHFSFSNANLISKLSSFFFGQHFKIV